MDTYVHSLQVKDLVPEKKYYFRVSAKNNIGVGEPIELQEPIVPSKPIGKLITYHIYLRYRGSHCVIFIVAYLFSWVSS